MSAPGHPPAGGPYPPPAGYRDNPTLPGQGYSQGFEYGAVPPRTRNGFGVTALVLGLVALVLSWTIIGVILGALALIFGLLGQTRVKRGQATNAGQSVAGIVLGILALLIATGLIAFGMVSALDSPAGRSYLKCLQQAGGDHGKAQQCVSDFDRGFGRQLRGQPPAPAPKPDHNPVYRADLHVPALTCVLPQMGTTNQQLETWVQMSVTCLDNAWRPVLTSAGLPFSRPSVRRFSGSAPDQACATGDPGPAFYCPADKGISVSPDRLLNPVSDAHRTGLLLLVMAHEYGHHIQELTGIMEAGDPTRSDYPYRSPQWLELSRRMELQATCFAGVGIAAMAGRGSVGATELVDATSSISGDDQQPGTPRDHGTTANNLNWFKTGLHTGRPSACNTWLATASNVA